MLRDGSTGVGGRAVHPRSSQVESDPLSRCVGTTVDHFAADLWGREHWFTPSRNGETFADLFSPQAVDELVSRRGLRTPFLRMAKNGSVLPERTFTRSGGSGASIGDQVSDDRVLAHLADGATLVLQALHRTWPPLVEFGGALSTQLGHPVQINSYVTPPQNQGFSAHYDTHDVFVLQIAGSKRWVVHRPVLEHPLPDQPWDQRRPAVAARATEPPLMDRVLHPGDALYLPRGYLHAATSLGELSIHLTVGIHPITGYRLADALLRSLRDDPQVRRSLPVGVDLTDPAVLAGQLRVVAARLSAAAAHPDDRLAAVAATVDTDLDIATRPTPLSPLAQLAAVDSLNAGTEVHVRPGLRHRVRSAGDRVALRTLDKTISLPAGMEPALRHLLDGGEHAAADLPGLDAREQLVLIRRLLLEGVVVPAATRGRGA